MTMSRARVALEAKINRKEALTAGDISQMIGFYNEDVVALNDQARAQYQGLEDIATTLKNAMGDARAANDKDVKAFFADLQKVKDDIPTTLPPLIDVPTKDLSKSDNLTKIKAQLSTQSETLRLVANVITDDSSTGIKERIKRLKDNQLPACIQAINDKIIRLHRIAQGAAQLQLDSAANLLNSFRGVEADVVTPEPAKTAFDKFRAAQAALEARKAFLDNLKDIANPAISADRKKFEDGEEKKETDALAIELRGAEDDLRAAIEVVKQARIDALRTQIQTEIAKASLELHSDRTDPTKSKSSRTDAAIRGTITGAINLARTAGTALRAKRNVLFGTIDAAGTVTAPTLTPNSPLADIIAAEGEVAPLITALKRAVDTAAEAYDTEFRRNMTPDDAKKEVQKLKAFYATDISDADKLIATLGTGIHKTNLESAKNALDDYLKNMGNGVNFDDNAPNPATGLNPRQRLITDAPGTIRQLKDALNTATQAVHKAIDTKFNKIRKDELDKIKREVTDYKTLVDDVNAGAPPAGPFDQALLVKIKTHTDAVQAAYNLVNADYKAIHALKPPTTPNEYLTALDKLTDAIAAQNINVKLKALNDAIKKARDEYAKEEAAAKTAKTTLADGKKDLQKKIDDAVNAANDATSTAFTKDPKLTAKHPNVRNHLNYLRSLNVAAVPDAAALATMTTAADDAIDLLKKATLTARLDIDKYIVDNVKKRFESYKELIKRYQGVLDITVDQTKTNAAAYKKTLAEMKRIQGDLELYLLQVQNDKNKSKVSDINAELKKLQAAIDFLEKPAATHPGIRHYSHSSMVIKGKDDAEFKKASDDAKKQLLQDAGYTAAGASSTLVLASKAKGHTSRFTEDFTGLSAAAGKLEGRMNLTVTQGRNPSNPEIVSVDTQTIDAKGVRRYEVEFQQLDTVRRKRYNPAFISKEGKHAYNQPNDRLLKHSLSVVLNYLVPEKDPKLKKEITDQMLYNILKGIPDPNLKKIAQTTPIFINQGDSTVAEAVMLASRLVGAPCTDSRGPGAKPVSISQENFETFKHHVQAHMDYFLEDTRPIVTTDKRAKELADHTTPTPKAKP